MPDASNPHPIPLSGTQVTIDHGDYSATIASIGASLRTLRWQGRDLVIPFDADEVRPAYRGAILAPWPNRVVDGTYRHDGRACDWRCRWAGVVRIAGVTRLILRAQLRHQARQRGIHVQPRWQYVVVIGGGQQRAFARQISPAGDAVLQVARYPTALVGRQPVCRIPGQQLLHRLVFRARSIDVEDARVHRLFSLSFHNTSFNFCRALNMRVLTVLTGQATMSAMSL